MDHELEDQQMANDVPDHNKDIELEDIENGPA